MARKSRTTSPVVELNARLREEPYAFDFYQAVRLLDCANLETPSTGTSETPKDDPFRFSQEASLAFSPATLSDFEDASVHHPARLVQRFFGLFGPQGALPVHLTDHARSRIRHHGDHTFHRFLDIFHHRMLSLFYRSWARVRPTVNLDRGVRDRFGEYVAAVFGLGMDALAGRDELPDLAKRHYSGLLSCQTKHAAGLHAMLEGYFGLPVDLEQFVGQWIPLPEECVCRLGETPAISTLGESIAVGSHVWDCQQKFRVQFGPLDLADYYHLLPVTMEFRDAGDEPVTEEEGAAWGTAAELADTLYYDVNLFTGRKDRPWVEAVAVRQGRTLGMGTVEELLPLLGEATQVVNLQGAFAVNDLRLELPGQDPSTEPAGRRSAMLAADQQSPPSVADLMAEIREQAGHARVGTWLDLQVPGNPSEPPLTAAQLDEAAPHHPVVLRYSSAPTKLLLNRIAWNGWRTGALGSADSGRSFEAQSPAEDHADPATGAAFDELLQGSKNSLEPDAPATPGAETPGDGETAPQPRAAERELAGADADACLAGLESPTLPALVRPRTECELSPEPSDRWHILQATLQQTLRKLKKSDDPGDLAEARQWMAQDPAESRSEPLDYLALVRSLSQLSEGQGGCVTNAPTNLLVLSQDLFELLDGDNTAAIADTRLVKSIRDGRLNFDLLASGDTDSLLPQQTFADIREDFVEPASPSGDSPGTGHRDQTKTLDSLISMIRGYVGDHLQWDVQLILKSEETPPMGLGIQGHLGWSSWLLRDPMDRDPSDLILDAMTVKPESKEPRTCPKLGDWDHRVLGQTLGGDLLLSRSELPES